MHKTLSHIPFQISKMYLISLDCDAKKLSKFKNQSDQLDTLFFMHGCLHKLLSVWWEDCLRMQSVVADYVICGC